MQEGDRFYYLTLLLFYNYSWLRALNNSVLIAIFLTNALSLEDFSIGLFSFRTIDLICFSLLGIINQYACTLLPLDLRQEAD